ncbi:hypothetical protein SHELI_v1c02990 [Spiroplasma helicoides]|uniref:Uncharacterized protein n=1 Tax=Spiroplasma helicoides TaxID=216938 RepID=A0A1B3SJZ4_9MOLU|nr:hypothetical protein [Spiroplasma helicoides]AOG60254.1 hypothetical protein SHELI_v1c02990 [Spiroplasma helicoides]
MTMIFIYCLSVIHILSVYFIIKHFNEKELYKSDEENRELKKRHIESVLWNKKGLFWLSIISLVYLAFFIFTIIRGLTNGDSLEIYYKKNLSSLLFMILILFSDSTALSWYLLIGSNVYLDDNNLVRNNE